MSNPPLELSELERAVLLLMSAGWRLIDPANGPAYLEQNGTTAAVDASIGMTIGFTASQVPIVECVQRGDPVIYIIRSVTIIEPIAVPASLLVTNAVLEELEQAALDQLTMF